ncbi:MAG: aminomethyl-transferring glycine dehydrogenase subunit GcvPA [Pirellulaceae bacterium]
MPAELKLSRPLAIPEAMSEIELTAHMQQLAARNLAASNSLCFLGGGAYDHFVPAVVDSLASRGEFYTSYTPYQPEVSQGNLQAMFEYQTLICQLTGMDVSNASLYDGASATIEAVLMCRAVSRREKRVVVVGSLHPEYRQVLETYLVPLGCEVVVVEPSGETVDVPAVAAQLNAETACLVVQHPNFFGCLEDVSALSAACREQGVLVVQVFDPTSLGVLKRPADLGADVAVAEGQCLGNPLQFGGPYLGILACKESFMRRMPGRIAGQTVSGTDRRCWVLTLQTREQHIRRDKATSNVCTNQGLFALRASIYLALMGKQGMRELGESCLRKAHHAQRQLVAAGWERRSDAPFFKEFVVRDPSRQIAERIQAGIEQGVLVGVDLGRWWPELSDSLLIAVTEKRTRSDIDRLVDVLALKAVGV